MRSGSSVAALTEATWATGFKPNKKSTRGIKSGLRQNMNLKLTDKTALVSGSTKGIGFAIATGLAREGARVIVNGRSEKAVAEAKEQIDQTVPDARIEIFAGDLSTAAATDKLLQRFPLVEILVNNLGIYEPKPFRSEERRVGK